MKVYLVAINEEGKYALQNLIKVWKSQAKFRILRMMGHKVHFEMVKETPYTVRYYQVDFNTAPNMPDLCNSILKAIYPALSSYRVTKENTEVIFE